MLFRQFFIVTIVSVLAGAALAKMAVGAETGPVYAAAEYAQLEVVCAPPNRNCF
jgi:hypothetical protein